MGSIRAARLESSPRLQSVHTLLKTGLRYSTRDIIDLTGYCAISAIASELRANGITVKCEPKTENGQQVHYYWIPRPAQPEQSELAL